MGKKTKNTKDAFNLVKEDSGLDDDSLELTLEPVTDRSESKNVRYVYLCTRATKKRDTLMEKLEKLVH